MTGGGSGIGQGMVKRLLDEGGTVHAIDLNAAGLDDTAKVAAADNGKGFGDPADIAHG